VTGVEVKGGGVGGEVERHTGSGAGRMWAWLQGTLGGGKACRGRVGTHILLLKGKPVVVHCAQPGKQSMSLVARQVTGS
jgi:hypothetical protein